MHSKSSKCSTKIILSSILATPKVPFLPMWPSTPFLSLSSSFIGACCSSIWFNSRGHTGVLPVFSFHTGGKESPDELLCCRSQACHIICLKSRVLRLLRLLAPHETVCRLRHAPA